MDGVRVMVVIESKFSIGDRVIIDGCKSLIGVVTAITWRNPHIINCEISWVCNGESKRDVVESWRLTLAEQT